MEGIKNFTFDELVEMQTNGEISLVQFVQLGPDGDDYNQWCKDHGEEPTESNAELFMKMTDQTVMDGQLNL